MFPEIKPGYLVEVFDKETGRKHRLICFSSEGASTFYEEDEDTYRSIDMFVCGKTIDGVCTDSWHGGERPYFTSWDEWFEILKVYSLPDPGFSQFTLSIEGRTLLWETETLKLTMDELRKYVGHDFIIV